MPELDVDPSARPADAFGLPTATFLIVASMVGVGVLTTSGLTVYDVGSNQLMLVLWVVGGLTAACGALTLCELSAALPRTGGDYVYLREAYGPAVAFLSGWVSFIIGFAPPSAAAAFAASKYLLTPLGLPPSRATTLQRCLATVMILAFALIHNSGRRQTARVQGWVTSWKLLFLGAFAVAGLVAGRHHFANLADRPPMTPALVETMLASLVWISYAYIGWNTASYLAGEFADPQRQLPRAILLGTGGVIALYLALNVVYGLALPSAEVRALVDGPVGAPPAGRNLDAVAPVAELAGRRLFGAGWSGPLSVAFGLMLLSSLSAYLLTGPRVIYAMARAGQFPAVAGRLSPRTGTPAVATALVTAVALAMLWLSSLSNLVAYAGVGIAVFSMLAVGSVYVLRWRRPDLPRPFRTPGYPVTPAVYLVINVLLVTAVYRRNPVVSTYAVASILAGLPIYVLWSRLTARQPAAMTPPL